MKKIIASSLILLISGSVWAQRKVDESYAVSGKQKINLELKFADTIRVLQWSNATVKVQASVNIDSGAGNEAYQLKTAQTEDSYSIKDDYGDYFEKRKDCNNCHNSLHISYVIYVPYNAHLFVKSISGDLLAENFQGELETQLVSGDVEIKRYKGALKLKTVSGNLDVAMNTGSIDARTVTGTIYSNLDIDIQNKDERRAVTSHIKGSVNNGTEPVKLETVSGNIYMRKQ